MPEDTEDVVMQVSGMSRWLLLATVIVVGTAYNAATFTASAILPQLQGSMAATEDEIAWTVTFNILAAAICTPMTGWLIGRFGRRRVMIGCTALLMIATIMCGLSGSLEEIVGWRALQGAAGAPLLPLGQTLLLDVFPKRQHTMVIAVFGMANTVGPVAGPTFGGYLAEHHSWRWAFFMVVPLSAIALVGAFFSMPKDKPEQPASLDWLGFLSLSTAIAAAQLVLSRGSRLDWYESTEIWIETLVAVIAFYVFLAHSLTSRRPFLNLGLLRDRNYSVGLLLITLFGMLNFTPMVLLPPMMQAYLGFPDTLVGVVISWRGIGVGVGFFCSMLSGRMDPRFPMLAGFAMQVISGIWLMGISLDFSVFDLCANGFLQGLAVGLIWAPIATASFWTLAPADRPEGVAVFHLMRSIGSSFFISVAVSEVVRSTGANYSRLGEDISAYNKTLTMPSALGGWSLDSLSGLARLGREMVRQAALIGYGNAFMMYTVASVLGILLSLLVHRAGPRPASRTLFKRSGSN